MEIFSGNTKKGMTLVELIVAIGILGIVSIGTSIFFVYVWKEKRNTLNIGQSSFSSAQSISKAVENIRKMGRAEDGAHMIESANDFDLVFYGDVDEDGDMEKVHYYAEGGFLKAGVIDPVIGGGSVYPGENENISIVGENMVNESGEPIFYYYDKSNSLLATPAPVVSVRLIKIHILTNSDPDNIIDISIESSVAPRNFGK